MFLVDDILLSPFKGIWWIMKQIHNAVEEEMAQEEAQIVEQLSELYMQLETGRISEEEFDAKEAVLLDRLDELRADDVEGGDIEDDDGGDDIERS